MRELIDDVFTLFTWLPLAALLAGIAKTTTGKASNQWKHLVNWKWSVFKCSDTM